MGKKYPVHRVKPVVALVRSRGREATVMYARKDIAHIRAVLDFIQEATADERSMKALGPWLPADDARVGELRVKLKEGLTQLFARPSDPDQPRAWDIRAEQGFRVRLEKSGAVSYLEAAPGDALLLRTIQALSNCIHSIRRCGRSECERLFVPTKRQAYCSPQCSQKARFERFRSKLSPESWGEKRHRYYVAQVAKTQGESVARRVQRRAPRTMQTGE